MTVFERRRGDYCVSTDPEALDIELIAGYLSGESYWATGRPLRVVQRSIANSLCFGLFERDHQIGFARVVTDRATFAWLCDVFVLRDKRGQGLGKWLVSCVMDHPDLQGIQRFMLATRDAHGLYQRHAGFVGVMTADGFMTRPRRPAASQAGAQQETPGESAEEPPSRG